MACTTEEPFLFSILLTLASRCRPANPGGPIRSSGAYRHREGLTQKRLAELIGIPQHHISEMENGKRTIGKERARRLAEALHCDCRQLL